MNSSRVCQVFGFRRMMVSLPRGAEITVAQAMTIVCCISVSAEMRTSVVELVPIIADADAAERCCAGRMPDSLRRAAAAEAMQDQIDTLDHQQVAGLIHGNRPFASNVHAADGHDGRDDGVDFLGRSLLIRLFIAGRILADADI